MLREVLVSSLLCDTVIFKIKWAEWLGHCSKTRIQVPERDLHWHGANTQNLDVRGKWNVTAAILVKVVHTLGHAHT